MRKMENIYKHELFIWISLGILSIYANAENAYGDKATVFTAMNAKFDEDFRNIISVSGTPLDKHNTTQNYPGFSFESGFRRPLSCAVDYHRNELYVYDFFLRGLVLLENFNSSAMKDKIKITQQHYGISREYGVKVAVDWISHNVYWSDPTMNWIAMQPGGAINDQTRYKVVVHKNLNDPRGLAVDPIAGYLFWSDVSRNPVIERSSLLGESRVTLFYSQLTSPETIVADPIGQRIYWTDLQFIDSASYDGTQRMHVVRDNSVRYFDMAIFQDVIIATDVYNFLANQSPYYARFYNRTTGKELADNRIVVSDEVLLGVCLYNGDVQPQRLAQDRCKSAGCQDMCVNEPTKATCVCREGFTLNADGKSCTEDGGQHQRAVVINTGRKLCLLDIRILSDHHDYAPVCFYNVTGNDTISFFEVDMKTREVFFAINSTIYRVNIDKELDGNYQDKRILDEQIYNIIGMSLDYARGRLYFAIASDPPQVWHIDLTTRIPALQHTVRSGNLRSLTAVPEQNKLYWLAGVDLVQSVDLGEGATAEILNVTLDIQLQNPKQIIHDRKYERLYVSVGNTGQHTDLIAVNYNGSVSQYYATDKEIADFTIYKEYILFLNMIGDKYVMRSGNLALGMPLQVTDEGSIIGVDMIKDLTVLDGSLQTNITNACGPSSGNGGCDHICLSSNGTAVCQCKLGFYLGENGKTCFSSPVKDNFILVTDVTYNEILQIPLDNSADVIGIKTPDIGRPDGVMYNYQTGELVWSNSMRAQLWAVNLNGTNERLFGNIGSLFAYPDRMVLDPSTGNVYYTGVSFYSDLLYDSYIGVINKHGETAVIVAEGHRPRDIALDPAAGLMFWTDYGTAAAGIYRANMDGTHQQVLFVTDIVWPNGLAVDYTEHHIYWADGYTDRIWHSDYDGLQRQLFLEVDKGFRLMDIDISGDYLYFTAMSKQQVTRVHKKNKNNITMVGPARGLGRLYSLDVYASSAITNTPVHVGCSKNNGGCSHFCLPTHEGYSCGCVWYATLLQDKKTCDNAQLCPLRVTGGEILSGPTCVGAAGNVCQFRCDKDHVPRAGVTTVTCTSQLDDNKQLKWDNEDLCQLITCPSSVENGEINGSCRLVPGSACNYSCHQGYQKTLNTITCTDAGKWNTSNVCRQTKCPGTIGNGSLPNTCTLLPEVVCSYSCNKGFVPNTDISHIMCQPDAKWDFMATDKVLCKPKSGSGVSAASVGTNKVAVGVGVGVGILVLIIIIIVAFVFLIRLGKISSPFGSKDPSGTGVAFENPRYAGNSVQLDATDMDANNSFSYTTLHDDKMAASATNGTYDRPSV